VTRAATTVVARVPRGLAAWGVALLCACTAAAQSGPVVARAASVTGSASLASPSGGMFALTTGYILNPGDRIDTRGGGQVVIDLSDGSMVVVSPGSLIVLKDYRQASSLRELFEIALGLVRVKINHFSGRPNPYRMNSPTASIAVRGTEFSIQVDSLGSTAVVVYEGAVEVADLSDPDRKTLVEAGRGVLVQAGQDFHLFSPGQRGGGDPGDHNNYADADHRSPPAGGVPAGAPSGTGAAQPPPSPAGGAPGPPGGHAESAVPSGHPDGDELASRSNASAYDRYISGLADVSQMPFLMRYNAFAESHLDSLENPAYATQFREGEARLFLLPSYSGTAGLAERETPVTPGGAVPGDYSISPQLSIFSPIAGTNFFIGGSVSGSQVGNRTVTAAPASSQAWMGMYQPHGPHAMDLSAGTPAGDVTNAGATSDFFSGSLVLARRLGSSSFGVELESLRGTGTAHSLTTDSDSGTPSLEGIQSASAISQTRLTAGYSLDLSHSAKLGVFYRYAFVSGTDAVTSHTWNGAPLPAGVPLDSTSTAGHTSEVGLRLRGQLTERLSYGLTAAWLGVSLADGLVRAVTVNSSQRDGARRASLGWGLGYQLTARTLLAWDVAGASTRSEASRFADATGAALQNGTATSRFLSMHAAVITDLTRRLFVSASLMGVWQGHRLNVDLYPDPYGNRTLVEDSFFPLSSAVYPMASRFSDFGAGWRFSRRFFVQYLFSTDYGYSAPSHTLMLRYTFGLRRE